MKVQEMKRETVAEPKYLEIFPEEEMVRAFFSTKYGASQGSPYKRADVLTALDLQEMQQIQPQQVHRDRIAVIAERGERPARIPETDGMVTNVPGVLLTTVHADCLPVWLFDPEKKAVGLVHAGWRGTVSGIASKAVAVMMEQYGSRSEDILCHIGPGIRQCCFEVGEEVYEAFKAAWDFTDHYTNCPDLRVGMPPKYHIDLSGMNRSALMQQGIPEENITSSVHCTCCEPELFCSYRREGGTYLRMGAGICLLTQTNCF